MAINTGETQTCLRVIVVGGGSAGHVLPALPVIEALLEDHAQVTFVGTYSGLEASLVAQHDVDFVPISAGKLRRYFSWQNFTDVFRILRGIAQSLWLVKRRKPHVVFSKGGFVSFPMAFAAWVWRVPVVAHESDLTPGLANRLVLPFAKTLCVSFAETRVPRKAKGKAKVVHTGTPLRAAIVQGDPQRGATLVPRREGKGLLIVTGGSLGADALNAVIHAAAESLVQHYDVLHVCGAGKSRAISLPGYEQREYIDDGWGDLLAAADVVVSRAGANALFELLALGKLNILVPLSAAASRGDQLDNAAYAQARGYSVVVQEQDLNAASLQAALAELDSHRGRYQAALAEFVVPDAAHAITAEIVAVSSV